MPTTEDLALGKLVRVRDQLWVVADIDPAPGPHTLVHLQSVEDGRYGERLSVIWQVEPGTRILPAANLPEVAPDRFDPPNRLAAFLDAMRWSAVTSAEVRTLQAPFRSGVAIEPYQLEPVVRATRAPRVNQLLADDVGLGKTIEAGLVASELLLRHRAKRVMVICPAGLTVKWRDELFEKFGLRFTVINSEACATLRRTHGSAANPFEIHPLTIVSLPWLRGQKAQRLLDEYLPPEIKPDKGRTFDLLILDEAHHVAPAAPKQRYAVDSQQTKLIRRLTPHFEHRLFLSATPHNGYSESFQALLELIDPLRFARGVTPDRAAQAETVIRRLKKDIVNEDKSQRFKEREVKELEVTYSDDERAMYQLLTEFALARRKRLRGKRGKRAVDLVTLLFKKRLISSPVAFARTVGVYLDTSASESRYAPVSDDEPDGLFDYEYEQADLDDDEATAYEDDTMARAHRLQERVTDDEREQLKRLAANASAYEHRPDAKAAALIDYLQFACKPDGSWGDNRVIVFTEYRDTQQWLVKLLDQAGLGNAGGRKRLGLLHGGMDAEDREQLRLAFQAHPNLNDVRILLATDAAGEGIDLQAHCHRLVNYDIPFNPNKLEQRIGRIDRYGQTEDPQVWHFVPRKWEGESAMFAELEFLGRVARKVSAMEADLGTVNSVLAQGIQDRMTSNADPGIDFANLTAKTGRRDGRIPSDRNIAEQVARAAEAVTSTRDGLNLTPKAMHRVVSTAFELANQQKLKGVLGEPGWYEVPPLTDIWKRATDGLAAKLRTADGEAAQRPVTFDPELAKGRDDVVLAHLGHPLLEMSTGLLRAAVSSEKTKLHRVAALVTNDPDVTDILVASYARFVLVGQDGVRLHEEILYAGRWLPQTGRSKQYEGGILALGKLLDMALAEGTPAASNVCRRLAGMWGQEPDALMRALQARADLRHGQLLGRLETRATEERDRVTANVEQFKATLRQAIADPEPDPGELFGLQEIVEQEDEQRKRDRASWAERLEVLDRERDRELGLITERYRDPQPHLFPIATVFVVPTREATR